MYAIAIQENLVHLVTLPIGTPAEIERSLGRLGGVRRARDKEDVTHSRVPSGNGESRYKWAATRCPA